MKNMDLEKEIKKAVGVIMNGGVVAFPTDTVWGFFCSPFDKVAVQRLLDLKGERTGKFFVLNSTKCVAEKYSDFSSFEKKYVGMWPAPFTMVVKSKKWCKNDFKHRDVESEGVFSIRVPEYDILLKFLDKVGIPLVSTSANFSKEAVCESLEDVNDRFLGNEFLDYIFPFNNNNSDGKSSTLFEVLDDGKIQVYRQGAFIVDDK